MIETIKKILRKENIAYTKLAKSNSGFTNLVYFVDDKYVVKVVNTQTKPEKLLKEISFYKNVQMDAIPKYVTSGKLDDVDYLIIERLSGESLYKVWHNLSKEERCSVVKQIAEILNDFHKQNGEFLPEKYINTDAILRWKRAFKLNIKEMENRGFEVEFLKKFSETKVDKLFAEQKNGLVYNDAHFDNFIYNNGKVWLIDFDRVIYCSIDYELLIIKMMLDNPTKFASEEDESNVRIEDYGEIWEQLKQYSGDMFNFKYINERVFIYQFFYRLGQGFEYNRKEWVEKELKGFREFFRV